MLRAGTPRLLCPTGGGSNAHNPLTLSSPTMLLRLLLKSIDLKVEARVARNFLRKRTIDSWRRHRGETDPLRQRFLIERAASVLTVLHTKGAMPTPGESIDFRMSRKDFPDRTTKPAGGR